MQNEFFVFLKLFRAFYNFRLRELIWWISKLFELKSSLFVHYQIQLKFEPLQNKQKKRCFEYFSKYRLREPILAILKLVEIKSTLFTMKFSRNLNPCKIQKKYRSFWFFTIFGLWKSCGYGHGWPEPNFGNALVKAHMKAEMIALMKA